MRILLTSFGTRGDVQPLLALGKALRDRGHAVTFVGPPDFADWSRSLGLECVSVGGSMREFVERVTDERGRVKLSAGLNVVAEVYRALYAPLEPLAPGCDVIVGSGLTEAGASLAEKYGKRYHFVALCPQIIPSAEYPNPLLSTRMLPRWLNRVTWWLGARMTNVVMRKPINSERARLGLPPITDPWARTLSQWMLLAADPMLAPLPSDLSGLRVTQTGAWFLPEPEELPADVEAFLAAGPAPIYVGFGSMRDARPRETTRTLLDAAHLAGARLLISRGWAELGNIELPSSALVIGPVPHGKLFPRCAGVVHHGGAGTTAAAARAGVPQVIVPHIADQFYWRAAVHRRGLSPAPLRSGHLRADEVGAAMRACLDDSALKRRAAEFARCMRTDGLERAVEIIEKGAGARGSGVSRQP
jgi:UDP:flavonoid glycosyltransferase YjiC (YdhE family)